MADSTDSLSDAQIRAIVYKGGEPPRVAGGHVWERYPDGRLNLDGNYMPDPHSTALRCIACREAFCVFCPDDGITEPCDAVVEGELAPPAIEA